MSTDKQNCKCNGHTKNPLVKTLWIVFTVVIGLSTQPGWAQSVVRIATGEWAPYVSAQLEHKGIAPHIITAAFQKVGIQTEYSFYPWPRAMKEAEDGHVDLTGIWFYNKDRAQKFNFSDSVVSSANVFFYLKKRPFDWSDFNSFPRDLVGVTRSYSYGSEFDQAVIDGHVNTDITGSDVLNFRKLLKGRIDAFPMGELVGYDLLKNEFTSIEAGTLAVHPTKISAEPLHLIAAKGNQKGQTFIKLFNKGLGALSASGELDSILASYK